MAKKLSHKKQKSIVALLSCDTVVEASAAAGVGHRTLCRWLAEDDDFRLALAAAEAEAISAAARRIAYGASLAVSALIEVLENDDAETRERIAAADKLLSHLPKTRLLGSLEKAVEEIKSRSGSGAIGQMINWSELL